MFILKRQDVEISNVRHPEKDQQIPILSYQGQTFTLLNVFGANQAEEARALWRDLTDNRGKACVLLEEPDRFSVWGKVRLDRLGTSDAGGGSSGAAPTPYVLAALLLLQAVYFDIEDLLGERQGAKFRQEIGEVFKRLQFPALDSPPAVSNILEVNPFESTLPSWQELQIVGLLQELHSLGKSYFGNTNFTSRAFDALQEMNEGERSEFSDWLGRSPAAKLWR